MHNEIGLILGRKGTGKSTLARKWIETTKRNVVLDSIGSDYTRGAVVHGVSELVSYYNQVQAQPDFCIIFKPQSDPDCGAFFRFARRTWATWIWVDECDRYCSPYRVNPDLHWILNYGRHRWLNLVGIARRAAQVHRDWTAQADWLAVHQTTERRDIEYLAYFMETAGIETLAQGKYLTHGVSAALGIGSPAAGER